MSVPIDARDQVECLNGTFDNADHWDLWFLWTIGGGVASCDWPSMDISGYLKQNIEFLAFHTYQVNFDINVAIGLVNQELWVFLDAPYSGRIGKFTTVGHKTFLFQPIEDQAQLKFQIVGDIGIPGEIEIDNVTITDIAIDLAIDKALAPQPDTYWSSWKVDDEEEILRFTTRFDNSRVYIRKEL